MVSHNEWQTVDRHLPELHGLMRSHKVRYLASPPLVVAYAVAAEQTYRSEGVSLIIVAGKNYGNGSSRDWAAKGPRLLGVRAVIAGTFERIHCSNLVGMGILPVQFLPGDSAE